VTARKTNSQPSNRAPLVGRATVHRPSIRRPPLLLATLLTLSVAFAAALPFLPSAEARLEFPPPQTISPAGESALGPMVAVDSQDRATVVWWRFDGANERIESVRLGGDGTPEEVETLFTTSVDRLLPAPQVAVEPQGRATVAWERDAASFSDPDCSLPASRTCVQAVHVDAEGNPGTVHTLAGFDIPERDPDLGGPGESPRVAVDTQGRATVVWLHLDRASGESRVQSMRLGADGGIGEVQTLSEDGAGDPKVAVDSQGRATVAWPRFDGPTKRIESVRLGADGTPGAVETLSKPGQNADFPQVAVDQRGQATVVWQRTDRRKRRIQSVHVGTDGTPGAVTTLSRARAFDPRVAVDRRGRATVVWERTKQTKRALVTRVQSVRLRPNGSPRAVKALSQSGASEPEVAVDRQGRATVVWIRTLKRADQVEARRLGARGAPGAVETLFKEEGVGLPQVAVDSEGRPTVVWELSPEGVIQSTRGDSR